MAAGGWFDWSTGDLVTEARFQDIQDSLVFIFASESAANSALTNKVVGTVFFDTGASLLKAWNGSSWITAEAGDIEGITTSSTSGLDGGATSGTPSLSVKPNSATSGTVAAGDEILFGDINDSNNLKKTTAGDIAALASGGKVLQVVTGTTTSDTGALATTSFTDTGLSASITPSATSSKVLVLVTQTVQYSRDSGNEQNGIINIMRATTELGEYFYKGDEDGRYGPNQISLSFLDSPSSTSALTYKTQIKASTTSNSGSVRANQQTTGSESPSHIHLIEIGA